jgi:hypothetical protein
MSLCPENQQEVTMSIIITTLMSMGMKLMAGPVIEKIVLLGLEKLVQATDSKADDELFAVVKEALNK